MEFRVVFKIIIFASTFFNGDTKYMEGELKTSENWSFLARFCFLSGEGEFRYYMEYNEDQGQPNLLLYYDAADQWPSVYKTEKTCLDKESILNNGQNQIINLAVRRGDLYQEVSGCSVLPLSPNTTPKSNANKRMKTTTAPQIMSTTTTTGSSSKVETTTLLDSFLNFTSNNLTDFDLSTLSFQENITEVTLASTKSTIIKRAVPTKVSRKEFDKKPKGRTIVCNNVRRFRSTRERWWFIAVSNCNGTKGINIKYSILMTNGPSGDYWHQHFSADEFYVMPVLMAFSVSYSLLILGIVVCSVELKSRQLFHSTYRLYVLSVFIQFFGILLQSVAYLKYAINGVGSPNVKMFGSVLMGCSETCFLLLLLLLAKGYTITRGRLSLSSSVKITVFMCVYSITYISLFVYEAKVFDPGEVLYLYESPAGYGLIILRVFAWCLFIYSTVFTLKKYPEKNNFYYPFNISGTLWFIAGPAFILSANNYIDKWVRESVVCAVLLFITFGGHLMFLLLTMPSVANKNFPYHVRTTQIGVMELSGNAGPNTVEHFRHHVYEPSRATEPTVIIPLTKRTEEIFGGIYSQHLYSTPFQRNNQNLEQSNESNHLHRDIVMENVLNWSLAKNVSTIELPPQITDNLHRTAGLDSPDFRRNGFDARTPIENGVLENPAKPLSSVKDWVKEVPVELFTINKAIVSNNRKTSVRENDEEVE